MGRSYYEGGNLLGRSLRVISQGSFNFRGQLGPVRTHQSVRGLPGVTQDKGSHPGLSGSAPLEYGGVRLLKTAQGKGGSGWGLRGDT